MLGPGQVWVWRCVSGGDWLSPIDLISIHRPPQAPLMKPEQLPSHRCSDPTPLWPGGRNRDADTFFCETPLAWLQRNQACLPFGQKKTRKSFWGVGREAPGAGPALLHLRELEGV